jgi:hypothetical protein
MITDTALQPPPHLLLVHEVHQPLSLVARLVLRLLLRLQPLIDPSRSQQIIKRTNEATAAACGINALTTQTSNGSLHRAVDVRSLFDKLCGCAARHV